MKRSWMGSTILLLSLTVLTAQGAGSSRYRNITILGTNDIHGALEASIDSKGAPIGGVAEFAGIVNSIRQAAKATAGDVLLVDAGDQFQGTLISNYTEGSLMFEAMTLLKYDAVTPGNHDYDFGPKGWTDDIVNPSNPDKNPRGALESVLKKHPVPLVSANTYFKQSIRDERGASVDVKGIGCVPSDPKAARAIDWRKAKRPHFLKPYIIKKSAGLRIALIGIDNPATPAVTRVENVSDLCFRDSYEAYLDVRKSLEGKADIFVMVIHDGNGADRELLKKLTFSDGRKNLVDALIAGHTHMTTEFLVNGVYAIQSEANGRKYGRIDLVWDTDKKSIDLAQTRSQAGIEIRIKGTSVTEDPRIRARIQAAQAQVTQMTSRVLGQAEKKLERQRVIESPLANVLADAFLKTARAAASSKGHGVDFALINTGGIRTDLAAGKVTYGDLFRVLPFNNRAVLLGDFTSKQVLEILQASASQCGRTGSLMGSGFRARYTRTCVTPEGGGEEFPSDVKILSTETESGEPITPDSQRMYKIVTLDFLASGGDNYKVLSQVPLLADLGVMRELLVDEFLKRPFTWAGDVDGRWVKVIPTGEAQ